MKKVRIHFEVTDKVYFDQLKSYILLNYHHMIECTAENYEYVITDQIVKKENYIIISEYQFDIFKYQKASKICSSIINMTTLTIETMKTDSTDISAKIIAVTSTRGGSGKTKNSQVLACLLASKHKKVFYMLLDSFSPMDGMFEDQHENDLSKFIYYCQQNKDVNKSIEAVKSYDHQKQVFFLRSLYPSLDGFMCVELAEKIVEALKCNQLYDYIILDIPTYLTDGHLVFLNNASEVIVINNDNEVRDQTYMKFLNQKVNVPCHELNDKKRIEEVISTFSQERYEK